MFYLKLHIPNVEKCKQADELSVLLILCAHKGLEVEDLVVSL